MSTRMTKKNAFNHVMVNVLMFNTGNPMTIAMTECGYDDIDDIATMDKDEVMGLTYKKSGTETRVPMKSRKKLLHLLWWRDWTV